MTPDASRPPMRAIEAPAKGAATGGMRGRGTPCHGIVTEFDPAAGLGTVTNEDGQHLPFHCAEIADGTRMIHVGAEVDFDVRPKLGRYEASHIVER